MSTPSETDACVSDLMLDRHFGEELPEPELNALKTHLAGCARCCLRCHTLSTQREAFLERVPSWERLAQRSARGGSAVRLAPLWAGGVALALAALIALLPHRELEGTRSKGQPQLGVYIKRGEQVTRIQTGDAVRAGDQLRFVYSSSEEKKQFALLHRDAAKASLWYPLTTQTVLLPAGRDLALDFSIELDEAAGDEQLYGLFCARSTLLSPLLAALQTRGRLDAPPDCQVDTIVLRKRGPE